MPKITLTTILNALILSMICLFCWNVILRAGRELKRWEMKVPPLLGGGRSATLLDAHPKSTEKTIWLYASVTCEFCRRSETFYRTLSLYSSSHNTRFEVFTSDPPAAIQAWLDEAHIPVDKINYAPPSTLREDGFFITPTLGTIEPTGAVNAVWYGMLGSQEESDVVAAVTSAADTYRSHMSRLLDIKSSELRLRVDTSHTVLLDTQTAHTWWDSAFYFLKGLGTSDSALGIDTLVRKHIPGSQLAARIREVQQFKNVVVDCRLPGALMTCHIDGMQLVHLGFPKVWMLIR